MTDKHLDDWLEGEYLKASTVEENDIIELVQENGLIENSFGNKKFEFRVKWNGKDKILSANAKQFKKLKQNPAFKKFQIKKKAFGNTFTMDFEPIPE